MPKSFSVTDLVAKDICGQIEDIRMRRRYIEDVMLRAHAAYMNYPREGQYRPATAALGYVSNIPQLRRSIERTATRAAKMLTPNGKWFETSDLGNTSDDKLSNADAYMNFIVRKKTKSRTNVLQLVRSALMYGRCYIKTAVTSRNRQVWPSQKVVDPFSFYMYPETANTIEEADIIFEDSMLSYERYRALLKRGMFQVDLKADDFTAPEWAYHVIYRLAHQGVSEPNVPVDIERTKKELQATSIPFVSLTERWLLKDDSLYQVYIAWNVKGGSRIVGFFESDYDVPLYKGVIHRALPGEGLTTSLSDDLVDLHYLSNDLFTRFQDAVIKEQGLIFADGTKRHESWTWNGTFPVWNMQDPKQDAMFVQPGVTSTNLLRAWQIVVGMINSLGGAGTIAEGQPGRNMPRAGGAFNNLITLAMADVTDLAELIQQEVLTPSLDDIWYVSHRFISPQQLMRIPGGKSLIRSGSTYMKPEDFLGNYAFEWIGAIQAQDDQARAQKLMILLNMVPSIAPLLQQQGYTFNIVEFIQDIYRNGLGERGLNKIVLPIEDLIQTVETEKQERQTKKQSGIGGLQYNLPSVTNGFVQQ